MPIEVLPEVTIVWPKRELWKNVIWVKRICIDLDGSVCEYDFPGIVKSFFGVDISATAIFAYDLADVLGVAPILIDSMFREQVYGSPTLISGAIDTLRKWKQEGHELVIYSNRVKYMGESGLVKWLIDYQIPFGGISDGTGKYDIHVDDSPSKLMATDSE